MPVIYCRACRIVISTCRIENKLKSNPLNIEFNVRARARDMKINNEIDFENAVYYLVVSMSLQFNNI